MWILKKRENIFNGIFLEQAKLIDDYMCVKRFHTQAKYFTIFTFAATVIKFIIIWLQYSEALFRLSLPKLLKKASRPDDMVF